MAIVYSITNNINNKSYIGMTIRTLEQRWNSHLSASKGKSPFRFHSALRKYGPDCWTKKILFESDDINLVRNKEEEIISSMDTILEGYNAKPGGCGGWIVPDDKLESWREKIRIKSTGSNNPNSLKVSNDEIIELAYNLSLSIGRIPSHSYLVKHYQNIGISIPKYFTKYRFNGNYKNLVSIVEEKTGLKYFGLNKTEDHKKKISESIKGNQWFSCDELQKSIFIKEKKLDNKYKWFKGRKYGVKN